MLDDAPVSALPDGFEDLAPFVAVWAIEGCAKRAAQREHSSAEDRAAFYDGLKDRLSSALDYLDQKGLSAFDAADRRLMALVLSFGHVALAVEIQKADEARHAQLARHMHIVRAAS